MAVASAPLAASPVRQPKGWLATFVVGTLMLVILIGGFVAEGAVADEPPRPVGVGSNVVLTPPPGWDFAGRSEDGQTILLTDGSGSLAISVVAGSDVAAAVQSERQEWLSSGTVTASEPEPFTTAGRTGRRFNYSGTFSDVPTPVEGTLTGIAGSSFVVLFDGWASIGAYPTESADVDAMIAGATIR